jgi:hypothetical protein
MFGKQVENNIEIRAYIKLYAIFTELGKFMGLIIRSSLVEK